MKFKTKLRRLYGDPKKFDHNAKKTLTVDEFKEWRFNVDLTIEEVAREFDVSVSRVHRWEKGTVKIPRMVGSMIECINSRRVPYGCDPIFKDLYDPGKHFSRK